MSHTPATDLIAVYDASGRDRASLGAWRVMFRELRDYHEIIWRLIASNISGQFKQSFIGYVWIALPPIASTLVFSLLRMAKVVNVPMAEGAMPYALFALLGTTLWGFFAQVTLSAAGSVSSSGNLVSKVYFPREVLVLSSVGSSLVHLTVRAIVLVATFMILRYVPHWQVVFIPLFILPMIILGVGFGMFMAPLNTVMPDIGRILGFLFQFGMFLAPTVYPTPKLGEADNAWQAGLYYLHSCNPVTHFMHAIQGLIETGTVVFDGGLCGSLLISFLALAVGWRFFHVCEPMLAERM
jgi:lipopolysaccharide transport system permease protein